jgi:glycosyltransferase involved in cell wall biosynthesis
MGNRRQPFVSVLTPVYNGEKYLSECIESVLAQEYGNWEYVIVNNCSADRSLEIARDYEKEDSRVRLYNNEKFLNMAQNWNHTLKQMSSESKYCKIVHADDWLFPNCLTDMVRLAEVNPSAGIVGSYVLEGNRVKGTGLPYPSTVIPGHEVCRYSLLGKIPYVFGSPTSLLIRSGLIRKSEPFYNDRYFQLLDQTACYDVLEHTDFGFVHQILTYSRLHEESQTSSASRVNRLMLEQLIFLEEYGPKYLTNEELKKLLQQKLLIYYRFLGKNLFRLRDKEFRSYHMNGFGNLTVSFNFLKLLRGLIEALYISSMEFLVHPKRNFVSLIRSWIKNSA